MNRGHTGGREAPTDGVDPVDPLEELDHARTFLVAAAARNPSSGATVTPRSASGRCRASSMPVTNRAPSAGAPPIPTTRAHGGVSISNRPRFSYVMGPGPSGTTMAITANPGKEGRVLRRRLNEVQANMQRTVEGIKQLAEASP